MLLTEGEPPAVPSTNSTPRTSGTNAKSAAADSAKPSSGTNVSAPVVCKVTDFGLAKKLDADDGQTRTGAIMGTPAYMAPEQAFGDAKRVGAAADVYALGAMLYECLTGRPPFKGATVGETLDLVRHLDPLPIRQLQPRTPVDLETIALKCLHKEPARRYATAEALAEDLGRFLDGRPIVARPIGALSRTWRWCRRNPLVACLLIAVFDVLAAGIAGTTAMWRQAVVQRGKAETNFARSEDSFLDSYKAVDQAFRIVSEDQLLNQPGMKDLRKELLQASLPFYEKFVADRRDDVKLRTQLAQALMRLAQISKEVESKAQAVARWQAAVAFHRTLHEEDPGNWDHKYELLRCRYFLGNCLNDLGRLPEAEEAYQEILTGYASSLSAKDFHPKELHSVVNALRGLGVIARQRGDLARMEHYFREAVRHGERLAESDAKSRAFARELAGSAALSEKCFRIGISPNRVLRSWKRRARRSRHCSPGRIATNWSLVLPTARRWRP